MQPVQEPPGELPLEQRAMGEPQAMREAQPEQRQALRASGLLKTLAITSKYTEST